jgi:hypothetical protein
MKIFGIEIKFGGGGSQKERRNTPREKVFETVYVDYAVPDQEIKGTGEVKDLTSLGLCFGSFLPLDRGTAVDLTLRFTPGSTKTNSLRIPGTVVRSQTLVKKHHYNLDYSYEIACSFKAPEGEAARELQAFIDWLKQYKEKYLHFRWGPEAEEE